MRLHLILAAPLAVAVAACSDTTAPTLTAPDGWLPSFAVAQSTNPGECFNGDGITYTYGGVSVNEAPEAAGVDENGNGWVCQKETLAGVSLGEFLDDRPGICFFGSAVVVLGDPMDLNGNGFVCQVDGVSVADDQPGTAQDGPGDDPGSDIVCPDGFTPILVVGKPGFSDPADENGNGYICIDGSGNKVDDILEGEPPPTLTLTAGKVNGHGVYDVSGATLSFSFHAQSNGAAIKGNFEFHDRATGARMHGEVTCLETDGPTALLEGVVSHSDRGAPAAGAVVTWMATDNGEGSKSPPDQVSPPESRAAEPGFVGCGLAPTGEAVAIHGGNVQVR
ncbi:MAG: hypothetical protein WEA24_15100 [Gemmatimonadota bacterium]